MSIAGKTGTAVIGEGQPEHAWFAGYVPADRPRYAMVVVLERAGNAATAACPVAKRLVLRMLETGLLEAASVSVRSPALRQDYERPHFARKFKRVRE